MNTAIQDRHCQFEKRDGSSCNAKPLRNSEFCYFHDPSNESDRISASVRGGKNGRLRALPADTPDFEVSSASDLAALLGKTISQVRRGEIDPRIANAVGYLSGVLLRAREQGELEERLNVLEIALESPRQENKTWH